MVVIRASSEARSASRLSLTMPMAPVKPQYYSLIRLRPSVVAIAPGGTLPADRKFVQMDQYRGRDKLERKDRVCDPTVR